MTMGLRKSDRDIAAARFFKFFTGRDVAALDISSMEVSELRRSLLAIGGPSQHTRSGIDLTQAANTLRVPRRTLERYFSGDRHPTAPNADLIRQAARKAQGRPVADPQQKVTSLLEIIGGASSRTRSGIDIARAAKRLGVSPGTVRRWINQGKTPNAATLHKMQTTARRMTNTKRGRTTALKDIRAHQIFAQDMRIDITATQGPGAGMTKGASPDSYHRDRRTYIDITADEASNLLDLYQDHGPSAVHDWVEDMLSQRYAHDDWSISTWDVPGGGLAIRPKTTAGRALPPRSRGQQ